MKKNISAVFMIKNCNCLQQNKGIFRPLKEQQKPDALCQLEGPEHEKYFTFAKVWEPLVRKMARAFGAYLHLVIGALGES